MDVKPSGGLIKYDSSSGKFVSSKLRDSVTVFLVYGGSLDVMEKFIADMLVYAYWKDPSEATWDEYDGYSPIVLRDYSGYIPWSTFLSLVDGTSLTLPTSDGMVYCTSSMVFIISNNHPSYWYQKLFENDGVMLDLVTSKIGLTFHFVDDKSHYCSAVSCNLFV